MRRRPSRSGGRSWNRRLAGLGASLAVGMAASVAIADEGGVSFWLSGQFGSLAAVPGEPGWSLPVLYYHGTADADGGRNFSIGGQIRAGVDATVDLLFVVPTYTFATPVLGGQAQLGVGWAFGNIDASADATLTGPRGNTITLSPSDNLFSTSDLYPSASLRWNRGNHNYMAYTMADIPVGDYEVGRLANSGINHWALDAGGGYTYFNKTNGREFSAVVGFTYNFENPDTDYRNGVSAHLDWAASQFLSERLHVGLVGYIYQQLTGDSGAGATLGDFKSRVLGIGPQVGYFFQLWDRTWYANAKGYYEFAEENRPAGWNVWLALVIPLSPPKK